MVVLCNPLVLHTARGDNGEKLQKKTLYKCVRQYEPSELCTDEYNVFCSSINMINGDANQLRWEYVANIVDLHKKKFKNSHYILRCKISLTLNTFCLLDRDYKGHQNITLFQQMELICHLWITPQRHRQL